MLQTMHKTRRVRRITTAERQIIYRYLTRCRQVLADPDGVSPCNHKTIRHLERETALAVIYLVRGWI
jgi:hypothetical protein